MAPGTPSPGALLWPDRGASTDVVELCKMAQQLTPVETLSTPASFTNSSAVQESKPVPDQPRSFRLAPLASAATSNEAVSDALRLLAVWAVRATRAHGPPQEGLDCSAPASDQCTPNRSTGGDSDAASTETG